MTSLPAYASEAGLRARTVFLGSGAFAVPILQALAAHPDVLLVGLVAPPDRPAGRRGSPVPVPTVVEAHRMGLATLQPERIRAPETVAALAALAPDLGVLADFGRIIPPSILELPRRGILNVHPSLLPRHRGATPIPATILAGDPVAGVSVIQMDAGLDTGPVLATRSWPLDGTEAAPDLEQRAAREAAALIVELLGSYLRGSAIAVEQDHAAATLTRPLSRADGLLDPAWPAATLERQVRAYAGWPGTHIETVIGRLAVVRAEVTESVAGDRTGELVPDGDGIALATADGHLRLLEVQGAGGRAMAGAAFLRGHPALLRAAAGARP